MRSIFIIGIICNTCTRLLFAEGELTLEKLQNVTSLQKVKAMAAHLYDPKSNKKAIYENTTEYSFYANVGDSIPVNQNDLAALKSKDFSNQLKFHYENTKSILMPAESYYIAMDKETKPLFLISLSDSKTIVFSQILWFGLDAYQNHPEKNDEIYSGVNPFESSLNRAESK